MLPRILEPEVMDSAEEAFDYDAMDHAAVNAAFVDDFLAAATLHGLTETSAPLAILDCGTGTARIPIELAGRPVAVKIIAVDLSQAMLDIAARNIVKLGLEDAITLQTADCKRLPFADAAFDAVMSNSIIHHLAEPTPAIAEMRRVLRPGGLLFLRDLLRPESIEELDSLVATHAASETEPQRKLFRDSLHAALTVAEVRSILESLGLPAAGCKRTSDRHWTVAAVAVE